MVLKKDEKEKQDKTLYYMMETIHLLVENEKVLLKRIQTLEGKLDMIAGEVFEQIDDDRTIN